MKNTELTVIQRIVAIILYISSFLFLCYFLNNHSWNFIDDSSNEYNLLFVSGALLLIFGTYLTEPYFTKPVDIITNATAIILALMSVNNSEDYIGYSFLLGAAYLLLVTSVIVIFLHKLAVLSKVQHFFYLVITQIGQSKVAFSAIYLTTIFSYFNNQPIEFAFLLTFWVIFITGFVVENIVIWFSNIIVCNKVQQDLLGVAIGCENPLTYKVEVDFIKHGIARTRKGDLVFFSIDKNHGILGIIINEKRLLNKKWLTIYLLEEDDRLLHINLNMKSVFSEDKTIFTQNNSVYAFDINTIDNDEQKKKIEDNYLFRNKNNFVGYVTKGSDINKIYFLSLIDSSNSKYLLVREGAVLNTEIHGHEALYQVIDGKTTEEILENHDVYGHVTGLARKLGRYNQVSQELETVGWLPNIYAPIFLDETNVENKHPLSIGVLPTTDLEIIIKEPDSLITHNTAILGILGIGKSCLTFELIQKALSETDTKVICIDITNEYKKELPLYVKEDLIQEELPKPCLDDLKLNNKNGTFDNPLSWGNVALYKDKLKDEIKAFSENNDKRVLLLNPDWHSVSKAGAQFKISHKVELTVAEKTRIISERIFLNAKNEWDALGEDANKNKARYLIVFEEAHSLVPEWNSAANSGDQNASNGTAKVILQGRKYGLGSFVVTQRTANISKSILNQCNTIFALRVFDDTGKQFLENYIGSDYSNILPTLEERHSIVVGKALKLKQPVIVKLNDREDIQL